MEKTQVRNNRSTTDDNEKEGSYEYEGGKLFATPLPGEEVVISGMSGVFPNSRNINEFRDNLFNKTNMMQTDNRWEYICPKVPHFSGRVPNINKYDSGFFGVHERQSHSMDSLVRIFLEKAVEAIFDAGIHTSELEGIKTGVYVGISSSEFDKIWAQERNLRPQTFSPTGTMRSMVANRLSYFLKLKGPSCVLDTSCSSSFFALEEAYRAIRSGQVDSAVVAGLNMCLHPLTTLQFTRMGLVSKEDTCRPFDFEGQGYVRSEAAVVLILQRAKDARRTYCQIVHIKTNCDGFKEDGITCPSSIDQTKLLNDAHNECGVDKSSLIYVEAHATGTKAGDPVECATIDNALASGRIEPLLIGSVKSNMGHAEAASGFCSIVKCILAMETGYMPPNINFNRPKEELRGILQGRIKVVIDRMPLEDNCLIGINNFGFGGTNAYLILRQNSKSTVEVENGLLRLVAVSGRTKEAVSVLLDQIERNGRDSEYVRLLQEVFKKNIPNHLYRGYSVMSEFGEISKSIAFYQGANKPLYFVFGETKNWQSISEQLMALPVFSEAVKRLQVFNDGGIDIFDVFIQNNRPVIGTVVVQIALIHSLKLMEIKPKSTFGYSVGALTSAYCNGVLTLSETLECAFILENIDESQKALHFKDPYLNVNGNTNILKCLKKVIESNNNHTRITNEFNNMDRMESNSVILEISDNTLCDLEDISLISLFTKENKSHLSELLKGLGSLYLHGYNPQISRLYPQVDFPVAKGTPMISPYIRWMHARDKFSPLDDLDLICGAEDGTRRYRIELEDEQWSFISGHVVDGNKNVFPLAGYLFMVWETFVLMNRKSLETSRVLFENCRVFKTIIVLPKHSIVFKVCIQKGTGNFQVVEGRSIVMTGKIDFLMCNVRKVNQFDLVELVECSKLHLNRNDVYKELRLRGLNYSGKFQAIENYDPHIGKGYIKWENNWISFIENMLQIKMLQVDTRLLCLPTFISKLEIDAEVHYKLVKKMSKDLKEPPNLLANNSKIPKQIQCGGVTISEIAITPYIRRKNPWTPLLETYEFVPNFTELNTHKSVRVNLQIILENTLTHQIKVVEVVDELTEDVQPLMPSVDEALKDQPLIQPLLKILSEKKLNVDMEVENKNLCNENNCLLVIASKILSRPETLKLALAALKENGYIISREIKDFDVSTHVDDHVVVITAHKTPIETLLLLKRTPPSQPRHYIRIDYSETFSWLPKVQAALKKTSKKDLVLYSDQDVTNGILGMMSCLRKEPGKKCIRCVFIMDDSKKLNAHLCEDQLNKQMTINVYKHGQWGTYRHLLLEQAGLVECEHCFVNVLDKGDLSSIRWIEGPLKYNIKEELLVYVYYSSLNMEDLLVATGKDDVDVATDRLEQNLLLGCEFSGRDQRGNNIMGMLPKGALSNLVLADPSFTYTVPVQWTLKEAATVPLAYTLALYSLVIRGQIRQGETVLIYSGSSGVGQAAIRLALHFQCEILTSITTQAHCKFLKKIYPQLKNENIFNCHEDNFEQIVLQRTKGKGVDLVLHSSSEEIQETSMRCLAKGGRLLYLSKPSLVHKKYIDMTLPQKDISLHGILLNDLFKETWAVKCEIKKLFQKLVRDGVIKPLNRIIFERDEVQQAFQHMVDNVNMEKVLIRIRQLETQHIVLPGAQNILGVTRYYCDPQDVYVIVGGLGGFGLELADWLILRGARKMVLTSRKRVTTGYQSYKIGLWKSYGVLIRICITPLTEKEGCKQMIQEAQRLGPIAAVFNLAMVISDASIENQTAESFSVTLAPKAIITRHLDELTRVICPDLRDFVVFSSVSCGRGIPDQTNYGMANSVMERICENRKQMGYPGLAIQWGMIGEVGLVSELKKDRYSDAILGILQQPIASCLEVLDVLLTQKHASVVANMVVAQKRELESSSDVVNTVTNIIGLKDLKYISVKSTLPELGMDSMLAKEIKQVLETDFEIKVNTCDLKSMTIERLKQLQKREGKTFQTA